MLTFTYNIKKYFAKSTTLAKELNLYQTLVKEHFTKEEKANHLIEAVLVAKSQINQATLNRQKYNLIKEIRDTYNVEDFFKSQPASVLANAAAAPSTVTDKRQIKFVTN